MNKICTSIDQSQKLIELGIDINTADMCWCSRKLQWGEIKETIIAYPMLPIQEKSEVFKYTPAWSLTALLGLIPESIDDNTDNFTQLEMTKKSISYVFSDGMLRIGFLKENLIDTAFEMVCWLKENGKL